MGTVVFPHARHKFYLTASAEERAMRRHKQLNEKGIGVSLPALAKDIAERDMRDSSRATAPLRPADDAVTIDSTQLSAVEVVAQIMSHLAAAGIVSVGQKT
jgi:cytidylate kinase